MRARRLQPALLVSTGLIAGLILSGCSSDNTGSDSQSSSSRVADRAAPAAGGAAPEREMAQGGAAQGGAAQGKDTGAKAPDLSIAQRSIIYRGSLSVRVQDVTAAAGQISGIATTAGGFVGSDNRSSSGSGSGSATMELRVPAAKFGAVVDQVSKLAVKEVSREIGTEDVTEETVDLDARITVQQARVDSGRRLLSQAKSLNDLVMLEREVATRESDLASLQAKKRRLADLTALSTITVTLLGPAATVTDVKEDDPGFLTGLRGGWQALVTSLGVLLTLLGALLPWALALGLPAWGVVYAVRRLRAARPAPVLASTGPPMAAPPMAAPAPAPAPARTSAPGPKDSAADD